MNSREYSSSTIESSWAGLWGARNRPRSPYWNELFCDFPSKMFLFLLNRLCVRVQQANHRQWSVYLMVNNDDSMKRNSPVDGRVTLEFENCVFHIKARHIGRVVGHGHGICIVYGSTQAVYSYLMCVCWLRLALFCLSSLVSSLMRRWILGTAQFAHSPSDWVRWHSTCNYKLYNFMKTQDAAPHRDKTIDKLYTRRATIQVP